MIDLVVVLSSICFMFAVLLSVVFIIIRISKPRHKVTAKLICTHKHTIMIGSGIEWCKTCGAYKANLNAPYRSEFATLFAPWIKPIPICNEDKHEPIITKTIKGGEGPDDACWIVECEICGCFGWKYGDGEIGWRP